MGTTRRRGRCPATLGWRRRRTCGTRTPSWLTTRAFPWDHRLLAKIRSLSCAAMDCLLGRRLRRPRLPRPPSRPGIAGGSISCGKGRTRWQDRDGGHQLHRYRPAREGAVGQGDAEGLRHRRHGEGGPDRDPRRQAGRSRAHPDGRRFSPRHGRRLNPAEGTDRGAAVVFILPSRPKLPDPVHS